MPIDQNSDTCKDYYAAIIASRKDSAIQRELQYTSFNNKYANVGDTISSTWHYFSSSLKHTEGVKDGPAISTGVFDNAKRSGSNLKFSDFVFLDIEVRPERINKATGEIVMSAGPTPPSIEDVAERLRQCNLAGLIYSTFSHSVASPRYRIAVPFDSSFHFTDPDSRDDYAEGTRFLAELLGLQHCFDHSKLGAESLFYLPRYPAEGKDEARILVVDGLPIAGEAFAESAKKRRQEWDVKLHEEAHNANAEAIRLHKKRRTKPYQSGGINQLRSKLPSIGKVLENAGYQYFQHSKRWLSPYSTSGAAGVVHLQGDDGIERIYVHHSSDPLSGSTPVFGVRAHDVIDIVISTEFGTSDKDFERGITGLFRRYNINRAFDDNTSSAFENWQNDDNLNNQDDAEDLELLDESVDEKKAIKKAVRTLNKSYAFTIDGGRAVILRKRILNGRLDIERIQTADFEKMYANQKFFLKVGNQTKAMPLGKLWLQHKDRRQYLGGVTFDPSNQTDPSVLNLWTGFGVKPKSGSWSRMRDHVLNVICGGNKEHFEYLLNWCARMVQSPAQQGEVAVILRSGEGTGKGIFARALIKILGRHGSHVAQGRHVVGHFNQHLRDSVFLFCDEAFQAGDKQQIGVLKVLVTEPTLTIEAKFQNAVQAPNFIHLMMASNETWVVPAGLESRRFFVLEVSSKKVGDRAHFQMIADEMDNGGYEAMLHELLNRDISKFTVTAIPKTDALNDQKKLTFRTEILWWQDVLTRGYVFRSKLGLEDTFCTWFEKTTFELLYSSYREFAKDAHERHPHSREKLGRFLTSIGGVSSRLSKGYRGEHIDPTNRIAKPDEDKNRPNGYSFGSLSDARKAFEAYVGFAIDWPEE